MYLRMLAKVRAHCMKTTAKKAQATPTAMVRAKVQICVCQVPAWREMSLRMGAVMERRVCELVRL